MKILTLVEKMSGQMLVHIESKERKNMTATDNVAATFPGVEASDSIGYQMVRFQKLVAPLIKAVEKLEGENEQKDAVITMLTRRLEALEERLN
jgi:hypothetical protein